MTSALKVLPPTAGVEDLQALFGEGLTALIADDESYYGLVTPIDLLNHLRRQQDTA